MSFTNSSGLSFGDENTFNYVEGNQFNGQVINFNRQGVAKRTKYDEFDYVKTGHIIALKRLHSQDIWEGDERPPKLREKGRRTIQTIKLYNMRRSKYTAMTYEGKGARALWQEDFRRFSCNRNPGSFQLFGINRSMIPALIFHHELIPCAHFHTGSFWMNVYLEYLSENMECNRRQLWMNTTSGMLIKGPDGPIQAHYFDPDELIVVPSTVDMLKDDVSFRFFSKFGWSMDYSVLECAICSQKYTFFDDLFTWTAEDCQFKDADHPDSSLAMPHYLHGLWQNPPGHLPMDVIGGLRFDTVYSPSLEAVARSPRGAGSSWYCWTMKGLVDETELDGGLTRFTLDPVRGEDVHLVRYWGTFEEEWLSQSLHVFDVLGVTEGKEDFFIVCPPHLTLQSTECFATSPTRHNAEHSTPIYLFLYPPTPTTISELVSWFEETCCFWSFDKTGQSQISEEECEQWRLPVLTIETEYEAKLYSWPNHIYAALRDWQKVRGFDPTTSDWAQSMSYRELEIIGTMDRFALVEEISDESNMLDEDSESEVLPTVW